MFFRLMKILETGNITRQIGVTVGYLTTGTLRRDLQEVVSYD